ncbi:hypothetical protein C5167_035626 [Papaver somniferum]|uniref:Uncharacterized protein n=1 Tax=Papaver somniferum TaxID=3469 RepID=A0A4Y7KK17_PAPSO|nr:hypothetical protein C5167_035626 [Papaver somniferum]
MANEDKADGNRAKRAKQFRPPLSREILYGEDNWISWVQQPFNLAALIERRNKARHMNWIHVASICNENGVSGFGCIIRDCHGIPIYAYSECVTDETEPVSEFYLEMKAVDKSLEKAEKLKFKNIAVITSENTSYELNDCSVGQDINGRWCERVFGVSSRIKETLTRIQCDPEDQRYVHFLPSVGGELSSALCLAGLAASEGKATLEFSFEKGLLPLGEDKLADLMKLLHTEATSTLPFHP